MWTWNKKKNAAELSNQAVNVKHLLLVREETHVRSIVEKDAHSVIRQLITKAIFVGIVHPLSHPLQAITTVSSRQAVSCGKKSAFRCKDFTFPFHLEKKICDSRYLLWSVLWGLLTFGHVFKTAPQHTNNSFGHSTGGAVFKTYRETAGYSTSAYLTNWAQGERIHAWTNPHTYSHSLLLLQLPKLPLTIKWMVSLVCGLPAVARVTGFLVGADGVPTS